MRVERIELKVGDIYKCPEDHEAQIVWISEDKKGIAIKCPQKHLDKVVKVSDNTKHNLPYRHTSKKERKIYVRNMVFLIKI